MRGWYTWHRRTGIAVALIIAIISVTGLTLMVLPGTKAGRAPVDNALIDALYSKAPERGPFASGPEGAEIIQIDNTLYTTSGELSFTDALIGAVPMNDTLIVASAASLLVIDGAGHELDKIDDLLLPGEILAVGADAASAHIYIRTPDGIYTGDESLSFWDPATENAIVWAEIRTLRGAEARPALKRHKGQDVSVYRVVLDLHSGRLFGFIGEALVWISTLIMLFLTGSGAWMWYVRFQRFRQRKKPAASPQPASEAAPEHLQPDPQPSE